MAVLLQLLYALVSLFQSCSDGDDTAQALYKAITSYLFVGILASMADLLALLAHLSQTFQQDSLDYSTIAIRLQQVRETIVEDFLCCSDSSQAFNPNMSHSDWNKVWNGLLDEGHDFIEEPSGDNVTEFLVGDGIYKGVQLHSKNRNGLLSWLTKFAVAVMSRLAERFPDDSMRVLSALEVFNPAKAPNDRELLKAYGTAEIRVLSDWYGKTRVADGQQVEPLVDPTELKLEWKLFKKTLVKARADAVLYRDSRGKKGKSVDTITAEWLTSGALTPNIETLLCIKVVRPNNTAMCERGFSKMKLLKSYLRNRLYIETLDALMLIALVGERCVSWDNDKIFDTALDLWEQACLRNPNQARFGNKNAMGKRRCSTARTELPTERSGLGQGVDNSEPSLYLDELADQVEGTGDVLQFVEGAGAEGASAEGVASNTLGLVGSFNVPTGCVLLSKPSKVDNKLRRIKMAYKFETGWEVGTFHGQYTGKKDEYKGFSTMYLDRRNSCYVDIN